MLWLYWFGMSGIASGLFTRDVREWLSCTHSLPFPWLRSHPHSHSRPCNIVDYIQIPIYSRKVILIPSNSRSVSFLLKQEEFQKSLIVVHGKEWFSLEAHKIIHYYSTLVSHSTHQWSDNDMLGWRSGQCKIKMAVLRGVFRGHGSPFEWTGRS